MAKLDKAALITKINSYITENTTGDITGDKLNELLLDFIDSLLNTTDDTNLLGQFIYDDTKTYAADSIVWHNGSLWIATAIATGAFDDTKFVKGPRAQFMYDYDAWDNSLTYVTGDTVLYNHRVYECISGNTNKNPETQPTYWEVLYDEDESATYTFKGQTTGTALETLGTLRVETGTALYVSAKFVGRKTDGSQRCIVGRDAFFYKNAGGALTQEGSTGYKEMVRSDATYLGDIIIDSGKIAFQAHGNNASAELVDWVVTVVVNRVKP